MYVNENGKTLKPVNVIVDLLKGVNDEVRLGKASRDQDSAIPTALRMSGTLLDVFCDEIIDSDERRGRESYRRLVKLHKLVERNYNLSLLYF